jgi:hypothetical protein
MARMPLVLALTLGRTCSRGLEVVCSLAPPRWPPAGAFVNRRSGKGG